LGGVVEIEQPLWGGQAGEPQPGGAPAVLGRGDLDTQALLEAIDQTQFAGAGLVEDPRQGLGRVGEVA